MYYANCCYFFLRSEFAVIETNLWIIERIDIDSHDGEGLAIMLKAEVTFLSFIDIHVRELAHTAVAPFDNET